MKAYGILWVAGLAAVTATMEAGAQTREQARQCEGQAGAALDLVITACTAFITSGQANPGDRVTAF